MKHLILQISNLKEQKPKLTPETTPKTTPELIPKIIEIPEIENKVTYLILEGKNQIYKMDSNEDVVIRAKANAETTTATNSTPITGDNIIIYITMFIISSLGIICIIISIIVVNLYFN